MPGHRMLAVVRTELRLLLRCPGFWLHVALLGALSVAVVTSAFDPRDWLRTLVHLVSNVVFFEFPLVALLAASSVARNRQRTGEWLWSSTLASPVLAVGQLLALALALCAALLIPVALAAPLLAFRGGMALHYLPLYGLYALALLIPTTLLELGIAFAVALWLRHTVVVTLLAAAADALLWLGVLMPVATPLTPLNHTLLTLHIDPVAGLGAEAPVLWPLFGLYLAASAGAVALSIWGQPLIDRRLGWHPRHSWRVWTGVLASLTGLLLAGVLYQRAAARSTVPAPVTDQVGTWSVLSARHTGAIAGPTISVDARLELRNLADAEQSGLVLGLNPGLQVRRAVVNGQAVQVQRTGEAIRLTWEDAAVRAGEEVQVDLTYGGTLHLLREDYGLVDSIRGQNPTAFQRPVRGYLDSRVVFLARDGDWRVWPLAAGAHLAGEANELALTVRSGYPLLSSGVMVEEHQDGTTYRWSTGLPQFLLAAGPYRVEPVGHDRLFLSPMGDDRERARAAAALALRRVLAGWLEAAPTATSYQAAVLPYAREVTLGGALIGLPADGAGGPDSPDTPRALAGAMARAWLEEQVAWPKELSTDGQLRSFAIESEPPDETGHQRSTVRSLGGINPQAPAGRLVETEADSVGLRALTVVLGQRLTVRWAGDPSTVAGERAEWSALAEAAPASQSAAELFALVDLGLLSPWESSQSARRMAALVAGLERLRSEEGDEGLARFVQSLHAQYPPGGPPLQDGELELLLGSIP